MTISTNPTIILVHGAWHNPTHLAPFASQVRAAGFEVLTPRLPSVGGQPPTPSFDEDVASVREAVESVVVEKDGTCIVVPHSYGGVPSCEALKGLGKKDREKEGKEGGVVAILFLTAWVLPEGQSLLGLNGGVYPEIWDVKGDEFLLKSDPKDIFYHDVPDETLVNEWVSMLRPQSLGAMRSQITFAPWRHIPSTYLFCEDDHAIAPVVQQAIIDGCEGLLKVERCDASHSPFASKPDVVIELIKKIAEES